MTDQAIRDLEAAHFQALVAMGQAEIPVSVCDVEESWCGFPRRRPGTGPKPTHGQCVHCWKDTEDKHGGEWMHDECNDVLIAEQQADWRADDPRRGQAKWINGR